MLGFKRQFEAKILAGEKTHTIRGERRDGKIPRIGERLDCYGDVRQKTMHLLGRWPCIRVERIQIALVDDNRFAKVIQIRLAGAVLDEVEADLFARRDGFSDIYEMASFWNKTHKLRLGETAWCGLVIHWDFRRPMTVTPKRKAVAHG
jgi:hypothetical protein